MYRWMIFFLETIFQNEKQKISIWHINRNEVKRLDELRDSIKKILLQQVQLLEQEKSPVQCDMICRKIFALSTALNAIQPGYPE